MSAGTNEAEVPSKWPVYTVVYVQSYGFVATVFGIGRAELGSVL